MNPEKFLDQLAIPPLTKRSCLLLDFDGTIVEFADHPRSVVVDARVIRILRSLVCKLDGRFAIVSGRALSDLHHFLPDLDLTLIGSYGAETHDSSNVKLAALSITHSSQLKAELAKFARACAGVVVEIKPFGAAIHYRNVPSIANRCHDFGASLARRLDLALELGDMTVEIRTPGYNKGTAVAGLLSRHPYASGCPVFVGDQPSDELAFEAVKARGGFGVQVGAPRLTGASYRLNGVQDVLEWLECSLEQMT